MSGNPGTKYGKEQLEYDIKTGLYGVHRVLNVHAGIVATVFNVNSLYTKQDEANIAYHSSGLHGRSS